MTSVVVRSWRCGNDSTGPKSSVDMEKCDKTICGHINERAIHRDSHVPGHEEDL